MKNKNNRQPIIKCCIFDLDGTLVDSLQDLANATNFALNTLGFSTHKLDEYKYFVGNGVAKLIERALPENSRTDEVKRQMRILFDENYGECCLNYTKPYNEIPEVIRNLKEAYALAVVTNKPDALAKKILNGLFPKTFMQICGNIPEYPTKPAPDLALKVAHKFNLQPQNCAFIGDSNVDIQTAINAQMLPIGVTWGFRTRNELQQAGAKIIVDNPSDLLKIFEQ